jgi:hypothetical protein
MTSNQLNERKEVFSDSSVWQCGIFFLSLYLSKGPNTKSSANRFPEQKTKQKATKNPILQHQIEELTKKSKRTS